MSGAPRTLTGMLLLTVGAGALISLQARVNAALALQVDSAVLAAAVSFATGLVLLVLAVLLVPRARATIRAASWSNARAWYFLGGLGGAAAVTSAAAAVPLVGAAAFTVAIVAGQVAGGLLVDWLGLGPGGRRPLSPRRMAAALLALTAIIVSALGGMGASGAGTPAGGGVSAGLVLVIAGAAGVGVSAQQAVNGRLRVATGSVLAATLVNFIGGTSALVVLWLVLRGIGVAGLPDGLSSFPSEPWLYVGGPVGVAFIAAMAFVVPTIGVLRQGLAVLAGMLSGALLLDYVVPTEGGPTVGTYLGMALAAGAVAMVAREDRSVPARRSSATGPQ